jgi:threonine synthase
MRYYSTYNRSHAVTLQEAVTHGLAPDNGLYMPERIPTLASGFFDRLGELSFPELAFQVLEPILGEDILAAELRRMVAHTVQFDTPLVPIEQDVYSLELFHGPTLAFKDFGARFMSQLLGYFAQQQQREIVILVATSGDTGSAVANGFLGVKGTRVIVLYPSGKVSEIQEKQFTTLGQNVTAIEVSGAFDDCQRLVKQAFLDDGLRKQYFLTSANSINIARLLPQTLYYFNAFRLLKPEARPVVFSVPSGNFGNLTGGLIAKRMGLPVQKFVASTNLNDIVPEYLRSGLFQPRPSQETISNAMDVGNPSNFVRMLDLYNNSVEALRRDIEGYAFTDEQTRDIMRTVFRSSGYVLDPHGAVAYAGLQEFRKKSKDSIGVFLETAHPGKFLEVVESTLDSRLVLPEKLSGYLSGKKETLKIETGYPQFRSTLVGLLG